MGFSLTTYGYELAGYEIADVLPTRLNDAPVVKQRNEDLKIVDSTCATIPKTINEVKGKTEKH